MKLLVIASLLWLIGFVIGAADHFFVLGFPIIVNIILVLIKYTIQCLILTFCFYYIFKKVEG
jgi:hypothetical protein